MTESFDVRPATHEDIDAMRAIERRAAQLYRTIGYDFCADGPVRDPAEHERVMRDGVTFVVDAQGDALAGFAMVEPIDCAAHLVEIDVDPEFQRRGLARRMIDAGADWARGRGFKEMTLTTYRDPAWNAPYYARLGFEIFEPEPARSGLLKTIRQEADWGFAFAPRVAMRRAL